ncbi:MAG: hypothetical protein R2788_17350 [Saprospiraceae bacterium]
MQKKVAMDLVFWHFVSFSNQNWWSQVTRNQSLPLPDPENDQVIFLSLQPEKEL